MVIVAKIRTRPGHARRERAIILLAADLILAGERVDARRLTPQHPAQSIQQLSILK
jgi:hypothetical protein